MNQQNMSEEVFRKQLLSLITMAKKQGMSVTNEQVKEAFSGMELTDSKLELIYDYLKNSKITVGEELEPQELLTEEERNYLDDYIEEIKLLSQYTEKEKEQIIIEAFGGDTFAKEKLIQIFLPEVVQISKLYTGQGVLAEDLIGEGNVALAMAMDMFECVEKPDEVEGFLTKMIMDAMEQSIAEELNEAQQDEEIVYKVNQIAKAAKELAEDLRRAVTVEELAAETTFSKEKIEEALSVTGFKIEDIK